jgi:hypothetical protein
MELKIEFTDKEITPWGGMVLMKKLIEKTGISEVLKRLPLPTQGSNRGYEPLQIIISFFVSVWCGASRFEHLEVTRQDEVIREMYEWKQMAGHKSFERYFKKFTRAINQNVFTDLYQWFFEQIHFDNYTLDLDSTVMTRYGEQDGASKGYNPKKPGRKSHHPLMAFLSECRMVANFWLRSGDSHTANNFYSFLEDTLSRLKGKTIGLLRADSGFYSKEIFDYLEKKTKPISYIIAARFYLPVKRAMASQKTWWKLDNGIDISETMYQSPQWEKPRRLVMIRQQIQERPKATGKPLRLFEDEGIYKNYRYSCFITNMDLPVEQIWNLYRQRADAENRIKELKYDFGADSFNVKDFYATEAALNFVMIAYNLMSLFRQAVLQSNQQQTLKTLRYKVFAVGSYLIKEGNTRILKLSLAMKRRSWYRGIWEKSKEPIFPYFVPT